ncbi:MAG TPA: SDR family oxidoreductase [Candidatus Dormibacteraeota bacterium]|nr:SDR family oxidoreductase [Candidatus Dormibacteraeota bacterium]
MSGEEAAPRGALGGKVGVVTGGASGIGRTIAKGLALQGARVVIADFDAARLDRTVEEILALGTTDVAQGLSTDVRSDASVRSLAKDSIRAMGQVDILINTAAVFLQGRLDRMSNADWTWMLETNLLGPVRAARAFLPHMQARGSGHIVNAIPFSGLAPKDPFTVPYDSAYAALATCTRGLARELSGTGIHVSLYCLGSKGLRLGQNTRSRGMGRWLSHAEGLEEKVPVADQTVDSLIEALHHPRFLVLADSVDAPVAHIRLEDVDPDGAVAGARP